MTDKIDINIPGYTIIKELGRGGMACVYLAMQESIERKVALKVMLQALQADPSFSQRFLREAKIVAQLSHPHIVAVYDVGISDQYHYIAMEYHEGGELKDKIKKGLTLAEAISIAKQMASALDFAHSKGYVHRDIKPENVLFKYDGTIVLSDFGIARGNDGNTRMTATGSVIGTPHYMSPEQAQGQELDGRSDLYSLGIVFFEMLVGVVPYRGDSALSIGIKHLRDPIPKLPAQYQMFQNFLDKLISKEPDNRWQTGADVISQLNTLELQLGDAGGAVTAQNAAIGSTAINTAISDQHTIAQTAAVPAAKSGGGAFKWIMATVLLGAMAGGYYYYMQLGSGSPAVVAQQSVKPARKTPSKSEMEKQSAEAAARAKAEKAKAEKAKIKQQQLARSRKQQQQQAAADNARQNKLSSLLNKADDLLSPYRLTPERIRQAHKLFGQARRIDSRDRRVADSDRRVADAYLRLASEQSDRKNYADAKTLVAEGLKIAPRHAQLNDLKAYINRQNAKPAKRRTFGGF
jgi:tetratricopeptide (TPR) repeat protein